MGFFDKVKKTFEPRKNFKYLNKLIHAGEKEIILESDIILDEKEIKKFKEGIKLDIDDLVIDGNGFAVDAKGKTGIFLCTGKNVTIRNIILRNGYAKEEGGAIRNEGEITLHESTLTGNKSKYGGAIYNKGELKITKSKLQESVAYVDGGAVHNRGELTIAESTFTGNTAKGNYEGGDGGAIFNRGELTITHSTFTENTAQRNKAANDIGGYGGAIRNDGVATIAESTFTENTARDESGGAIYNNARYNNRGELTITESTFFRNGTSGYGGAIYNDYEGKLTITDSTLEENTAQEDGGAIKNVSGSLNIGGCKILRNKSPNNIIFTESFMEVYNTKFNDNQSKHVLVNEYPEFNISIIDCEFIANNVEKDVIFNNGKSCTIKNTIFENNLSRNITNKKGLTLISPKINDFGQSILNDGHIFLKKSPNIESKIYGDGTVETDEIHQEETFDFGYLDKKIHEGDCKEIILNHDITFENYEIDFYEGGIELDMDELVIDGNGHTIDGANKSRIFIVTGNNITLKNITFKNGVAHGNYNYHFNGSGGAIRINYTTKITIENCKFLSNTAEENSGAIHNSGELTITQTTLTGNTATQDGGAIHNGGELTITESALNNNTANNDGGAIHNRGVLTIAESVFTGNTVNGGGARDNCGGAIRNVGGVLTIMESALYNNTARDKGGAIHNSGELTVTDSTLNNNAVQGDKYSGHGGAVYNDDGKSTIAESTFTGNTVRGDIEGGYGGAISSWRGELTIAKSTFTENAAHKCNTEYTRGGDGGAIYNYKSKITITESTFTKSTAYSGGAVYNDNGELRIIESAFTENARPVWGGAIYNDEGELMINDSTLTGNTAADGGAIFIGRRSKKYKSENCTFKDNKPDDVYEEK